MLFYVCLVLCLGPALAVGPCAPNEDLLALLKIIHSLPSYSHLSGENKALLPELISEAQVCQLTAYIYMVGFHKILSLIDNLNQNEGHLLSLYLQQHLVVEKTLAAKHPHTTKASHIHA
ncbi:uncharacterized protein LOC121385010 [Gigantopelta aegis]|uniref:uncharacterized protein LOC121385010 n=1 Tax=Gigantopelta aegis TaxID=1735272 RepID=UPI001B8879F5|nr:uncharacterized protein LOC121385010 [Gigantopelta aegis]